MPKPTAKIASVTTPYDSGNFAVSNAGFVPPPRESSSR